MADMELEVEAKLRELQLLAAENEQLKTRSQVWPVLHWGSDI